MNATRFSILGALAASLLLMPACDDKKADGKSDAKAEAKADGKDAKKDDGKADEAKADGKADEAKAETKDGAEAAEGGAEAAAGGDNPEIGVKICDEYITKYGKCIDEHAPENMKTQMKDALAKSAERFKKQSEGPEKDSLDQACTAALEAVKKTSKGWGCTYD